MQDVFLGHPELDLASQGPQPIDQSVKKLILRVVSRDFASYIF